MSPRTLRRCSALDDPPQRFVHRPFYAETLALLEARRDHDLDRLDALCDDEYGIVDADLTGGPRAVRNRVEWERWHLGSFATLDSLGAVTDIEVLTYKASRHGSLGFSVVEFRRTVEVAEHTAVFDHVATVVWKRTPTGWREARWHTSVVSSIVPEQFRVLVSGAN